MIFTPVLRTSPFQHNAPQMNDGQSQACDLENAAAALTNAHWQRTWPQSFYRNSGGSLAFVQPPA
jgi:hypothetical protein